MRGPVLLYGVALVLGLASPAVASLKVCNQSKLAARVALGRFDGKAWSSEGWWTVQPRQCSPILIGNLDSRFYYLYASDGGAGVWEGKTHFCVAPESRFKAAGRGGCAARGFDSRGFFEIDTGRLVDWTQNLSN
jgi:uncharacterized membrane protein